MLQEDLHLNTLSANLPVSHAESRHKTVQTQNWLDEETNCEGERKKKKKRLQLDFVMDLKPDPSSEPLHAMEKTG